MSYKGDSPMDCGYFVEGGLGMWYFPPDGSEPFLIPWEQFEQEEEEEESSKLENEWL